jgi:hypothetical protein
MHCPFVSQLLRPCLMPSHPRSQQHTPRSFLARSNGALREYRTPPLDTFHVDHVLVPVCETC